MSQTPQARTLSPDAGGQNDSLRIRVCLSAMGASRRQDGIDSLRIRVCLSAILCDRIDSSVRKGRVSKSVFVETARQRREVDRAQALSGPGLATADDCDDGESVLRMGLRGPKHLIKHLA